MSDVLAQVIFGWPFIILSLLISLPGLILKKYWLLITGAVLFAPFSYYLSGAPHINGFGILLPFFQLGSAFAIRAQKMPLAWMLVLPAFLISVWLAYTVLMQ
ncbi:MAG: hypothetical protein MUO77_02115 [Anaerolineales bacterium]|nr:hypothetical protein [Anaerolineales bacterium]